MCRCTPEIRTLFCGKAGCEWPAQTPRVLDENLVRELADLVSTCPHRSYVMVKLLDHPSEARAALDAIERAVNVIRVELYKAEKR